MSEWIDDFMEAVYPGRSALALASFNEEVALKDATATIARLRAERDEARNEIDRGHGMIVQDLEETIARLRAERDEAKRQGKELLQGALVANATLEAALSQAKEEIKGLRGDSEERCLECSYYAPGQVYEPCKRHAPEEAG